MAITVGVTGGIGSGKSTVCKIFEMLGTPVFEADLVAKELYNTNQKLKEEMIRLFGASIYTAEGKIDRKKLASVIFSDDFHLNLVNALVHPAVRDEFNHWLKKHESSPYIIHESALLFESGFYKMMDYNLVVSAPEEQRIDRVKKRDGITEQMVRKRMEKQWPEEEKEKRADRVLRNDNKNMMIPEIIRIDKYLTEHGEIW
jgi:dephospho-CoA kinase